MSLRRDFQSVLDAIPDGIAILDESGRVENVNAEACRLLESSAEHLTGIPVEALLGSDHALARLARSVLENARPAAQDEVRIERRFSEPVDVDLAVSPMDDAARRMSGAVVRIRDRTVLDSLSEEVSQRERLDSYGRMAAGIAHEVKNPLGGIRGAAELLGLWSAEERGRDTAALIIREVDRISSLVEELMVFARGDVLRCEPLNVHYVLDGVLDLLALDPLTEKVDIERFYDPSIPEFLGDADRLTQVFLNLCRNALQAMDSGGGVLTITTRMSLERRLKTPEGDHVPAVIVAVSDTGPGIAPEILSQLDTPFFTTRPRGTGLGLAVSRHWVNRHGGNLRIASQVGEGATARVALPLRRRRPHGGETAPSGDKAST